MSLDVALNTLLLTVTSWAPKTAPPCRPEWVSSNTHPLNAALAPEPNTAPPRSPEVDRRNVLLTTARSPAGLRSDQQQMAPPVLPAAVSSKRVPDTDTGFSE